ncbi:MAG: hypothetical protein K0S47_4160 [Herbinix sp.]|jgi:hypothetical protein|nr:hypothetical protein [Herbinix sp.]
MVKKEIVNSTIGREPSRIIKDDKGNILVAVYGEPNIETFARALLGMKQKVYETEKKTA